VASRLTKEGGAKLRKLHEPDPAAVVPVQFRPAAEPEIVTGQVVPAERIPDPQDPETDDDTLTDAEQKRLKAYEAVFDKHRDAWWEEGKALAGIVKGRLHRGAYPSLEAYLDDRHEGMPRPVAYRRIELWPLGERLSPIGDTYGAKFNEAQARDLKPYWKTYGLDATEAVYRTLAEADGVKVTAKLIRNALAVLPAAGDYDRDTHVGLIHAFLSGTVQPPAPELPAPPDPGELVQKFRNTIRRNMENLRDLAPEERRKLAEELHAMAEELTAD
jgi:hypothetical protein